MDDQWWLDRIENIAAGHRDEIAGLQEQINELRREIEKVDDKVRDLTPVQRYE